MSKAGQNTFSGISHQADITIAFALRALADRDLQTVIIEGSKWEDFTLAYVGRHEDFEVKWHARPLSYLDVREIVRKEVKKRFHEKDRLVIVARKFSAAFLNDFRVLRGNLFWWVNLSAKGGKRSPLIKKFLSKGWTESEIAFLKRVELREINTSSEIRAMIDEYFALEDPFYLDAQDQRSIVARTFRTVLEKGATGGSITRVELERELADFRKAIAEKSESFAPNVTIKNKVISLEPFLKDPIKFQELRQSKFLSPISHDRRLIFYIAERIESEAFSAEDINFFIEGILLKKHYGHFCMRLLDKKQKAGKASDEFIVSFVTRNFDKLAVSIDHDIALRMLAVVAEKDTQGVFRDRIFKFATDKILEPIVKSGADRHQKGERGYEEKKLVSKIVTSYFQRAKNKAPLLDFIFRHFDITGDYYELVTETEPGIFQLIRLYLEEDFEKRLDVILKRVTDQYQLKYQGIYSGHELAGGGISQSGSHYSITDIGLVRFVFKPLFSQLYRDAPAKAWQYFKRRILANSRNRVTVSNPLFLRRSLVGIILDRMADKSLSSEERREAKQYLGDILLTKRGIPNTQEVIFDQVRQRDLAELGFDEVMDLLRIDCQKYAGNKPSVFPTNLFAVTVLIRLVELKYAPAKKFILKLLKHPEFLKMDRFYDFFEQLSASNVFKEDADFLYEALKAVNLPKLFKHASDGVTWDKSGALVRLIEQDWKEGKTRGSELIDSLIRNHPTEKVLQFIGNAINRLLKTDCLKTYQLFKPYLKDKERFRAQFKRGGLIRQNLGWTAEALAERKHYPQAMKLIELLIDDPDPDTSDTKDEYNLHIKIKSGSTTTGITSVRGVVAWALQPFAKTEDPGFLHYILQKTTVLLDFDGKLAKKLGYPEPDLYVRLQALVPLKNLTPVSRRKALNSKKPGLGESVKALAFLLLKQLRNDPALHGATELIERAGDVVCLFYDLSTDEAKDAWMFCEWAKAEDAVPFIFYYAFGRERHHKDIPFDPTWFRARIGELSRAPSVFRKNVALQLYREAEYMKAHPETQKEFNRYEPFLLALLESYEQNVFDWLYRILELMIDWDGRFDFIIESMKAAIKKETSSIKASGAAAYLWTISPELVFAIREKSVERYLDVIDTITTNIQDGIHYSAALGEIPFLKNLKPANQEQSALLAKILERFKELYPDQFPVGELAS